MNPEPFTRTQLLALAEKPELDHLIESLKQVCQELDEKTYSSELSLLSGRYNKYSHERDKELQTYENLKVEFNQIKAAFQQFINSLPIPEGEALPGQSRKKKLRDCWLNLLNHQWKWSNFSAIISLLVIGIGQIHIQTANIVLRVRVSQLGLKTADEWKIGQAQDLFLEEFAVDLLQSTSPVLKNAEKIDLPFSLLLQGRSRLDLLAIPANQTVTIGTDHNDLFIRIATGPVQGNVYVQNVKAILYDQEKEMNSMIGTGEAGDWLDFRSDIGSTFSLKPDSPKPIDFPLALVDSVGFRRISFDQDSSTIKSGTIQVEGKATTLELGDHLALSKFTKGQLTIMQRNGDLELLLKAQVHQLKCKQSDGRLRTLMPTWLTYLRSNQSIAFYVGSFVLIFGFLYTLRKEFSTKRP